jgi:hypothetical protein
MRPFSGAMEPRPDNLFSDIAARRVPYFLYNESCNNEYIRSPQYRIDMPAVRTLLTGRACHCGYCTMGIRQLTASRSCTIE